MCLSQALDVSKREWDVSYLGIWVSYLVLWVDTILKLRAKGCEQLGGANVHVASYVTNGITNSVSDLGN